MIVDLERNDLSRVCEPGSVRWPELMAERELAGVTHLVSTVEGTLREDVELADLLAATFPGGSVPARPKIAALDLIAALEPVGRGASMGALGVVRGNGDLELALTIRTFAVAEGRIHLWVGGGIVWDSDPAAEIEESWTKARPLLAAIGAPRRGGGPLTLLAVAVSGRGVVDPAEPVLRADDEALLRGRGGFETLRVYGGMPFRLEEHLARLAASAERLGLPAADAARARGARRARRSSQPQRPTPSCGSSGRRRRPRRSRSSVDAAARPRRAPRARATADLAPRHRADGAVAARRASSRRATPSTWPPRRRRSARGADDAVFVDARRDRARRADDERLVAARQTLLTPSLDLGILAGVTRAAVARARAEAGYDVEEGALRARAARTAPTRRSRPRPSGR